MAEAVIISAGLDSENLTKAIDKLVRDVDNKLGNAAHQFEKNIGRMQIALNSLAQNASARVADIQSSFAAMGTTFQNFATAMERAARAAAAAGANAAAGAGAGGNGGGGGSGGTGAAQDTVKWLKEQIELQKKKIDQQKLFTDQLQIEVNILAKMNNMLKQQTTSSFGSQIKDALSTSRSMPNLASAENRLSKLKQALVDLANEARRLGVPMSNLVPQDKINQLKNAIVQTTKKVKELREEASRPLTTSGVLNMGAANLNEIQAKMTAIQRLRATLPVGSQDIKTLNIEYAKLTKLQDDILGKNMRLVQSNNALGRAFRYIANRLAFALSIGAVTNFVRQLYEVRGQYELLERSLGVLVNSFERGTQIFNELNEMAIKSPFTLIELGTAAKQLSAYNFAADEVVDTTKRLADISAALGVPMERLVYNLGQIKAQGVLNARDARDFANAGLAIVPMLAEMYTAEKRYGDQVVTTAQVYSMMSKKLVTYHDVLKVINQVTDEGGKFFDFQAKQAGTLKVQLANLTLAWNNMLNEIGTEQQATLTKPIVLLRDLFREWRNVERVIKTVILTLGAYKAASLMALASDKIATALIQWGSLSKAIKAASAEMAIFNTISNLNPIVVGLTAIVGLIGYFGLFGNKVADASEQVMMFGESASKTIDKVETLYKVLKGTDNTSETYKKNMQELNEVLREYGVETIKEGDSIDVVNEKRKEAIELIKLESAERERANNLKKAQEQYDQQIDALRQDLNKKLKEAITIKGGFLGINIVGGEKELRENANAISDIISQVVSSNIDLIANKTGAEYEKGLNKIYTIIQSRMRAIGISEGVITKEWLENAFFASTSGNIIDEFIYKVQLARQEQDKYNDATEKNYRAAKKATESTMTFTQKVEANARALRNGSKDAVELYNKVMDIVRVAQQNHVINFDLKLTAQNPPKWMFDKNLPELKRLAENFAAIAQAARGKGGANVNGTWFTEEQLNERSLQYASAAREKQYKDEREAQEELNKSKEKTSKKNKTQKRTSDELAEALKNEISIIKKLQSEYDKLVKAGVPQADALELIQNTYQGTLEKLNNVMDKFKLPKLDLSIIKGKDPNDVLKFFTNLRDILSEKGLDNLERIKAVEGVIEEFTVTAKVYNLDKVTKGLNSELDKLKEDYELAIELDANPELGNMFADMFGIDTDALPDTFGEAFEKANAIALSKLKKLSSRVSTFNFMSTDIEKLAEQMGLSLTDQPMQDLQKWQKAWRDMFQKNLIETEKMLDDYVNKYGDMSDKIANIEAERLHKIKLLNEAYYNDQMKRMPEYVAKLNAINAGAKREEGTVRFDEFKNSRLYVTMFENLEYVSTATLETIRKKLEQLKSEMGTLSPEQLKQVVQQFEKIDEELRQRSPFKGLIKNIKDYQQAIGRAGKQAQNNFVQAQQEYDYQLDKVTNLNKEYEQKKASGEATKEELAAMQILISSEKMILGLKKKELEEAEKLNEQYNLIKKAFGEQWQAIGKLGQTISTNVKSLGELRDYLHETFGVDLGNEINGIIDGLQGVGDGVSQVVSSAQGGDVVGVVTGTIKTVLGIGDAIASIFGGGAAKTRKINKEIERSQEQVRRLNMAYKELEHTVNKAMGAQETAARRAEIANKKAELAELERQLALEKSKRSKDRDDDTIKSYEEQIQDLRLNINDLLDDVVSSLLGSDVKAAAEQFVDTWVDAWRNGEDALAAITENMDEMIRTLIKKAISSKIVGNLLQPFYTMVDDFTSEDSAGGVALTTEELKALAEKAGVTVEQINAALAQFYGNLEGLDILSKTEDENKELSALQQGIQGITEDTAGALESYMNGVSQQVYYQSDILTQIRDILINFGGDVNIATNAQILFELQQSYQVQMSIQSILQGWSSPSGLSIRAELIS